MSAETLQPITKAPATARLLDASKSLDHEILLREQESGDRPILKNLHKLDRIRAKYRATTDVWVLASPIARVLRRDWCLVTSKMFLNVAETPSLEAKIRNELQELHWQIDDLADQVKIFPFARDTSWVTPRPMTIDIVHPLAASWLRAMMKMDKVFVDLVCAEKAERITRRQRFSLLLPSQLAYMGFKATSMQLQLKTASELLAEMQL